MSISSVSKRFLDSTKDGNWTSNQAPKFIEDLHAFIVRLMNYQTLLLIETFPVPFSSVLHWGLNVGPQHMLGTTELQ